MTDKPDLSDVWVGDLLSEIQGRGYFVARTPLEKRGRTVKADLSRWSHNSGKTLRFGVVSDTHLCSRYQQLSHLHSFYALCARKRINTVLHSGDLIDGERMYRGQEYEVFVHGADRQRNYAVDHYPSRKGIKTLLVSGNHDQSFLKTAGYNIAEAVCKEREDMEYLGDDVAYLSVDKVKIALFHGRGGVAYARSYRSQKIVEQLPHGPDKPHMLFLGHFHVPNHVPGYRNVEVVQLGCFQSQTPYLAAKGLHPFVAGLIVTVKTDKDGLASVGYEWIPFYVSRKDDF